MTWICEACTFSNSSVDAQRCEICETRRGDALEFVDKSHLTTRKNKPSKAVVQATLFGGVATSQKLKLEPQKPIAEGKRGHGDSATTQATIPFAKKPNVRGSNGGLSGFKRVDENIPFKELKVQTKLAMDTVFSVSKLRFLQPKAVSCALKRKSQLVVMATGGGKSLCYQLPAVVMGGVTIVVSPLIALMQNQVSGLIERGIEAAVISSAEGQRHNTEVLERMVGRRLNSSTSKNPTKAIRHLTLVYVTPEQITTTRFREVLDELNNRKRLTLFAIDEAHCLSSWGHDFRKAYLKLDYLRDKFPRVPLIACTATATPNVIKDIKTTLRLQDCPCHIGSFDRPNIFYKVKYKDSLDARTTSLSGGGGGTIGDLVSFIGKQHDRCKKKDVKCSGIVYVHTRAETAELASAIRKGTGIAVVAYHGGLKAAERNKVQESWTSGVAPIAVATVAFGMGIDLAHVRYVVHYTMPKSPESFYQESGRAGRDGLPSFSLLYYSKRDASKFQYFLSLKKNEDGNKGLAQDMDSLEEMVKYCTVPGCRRFRLLKHFGESMLNANEICKKTCDFCVNPERVQLAIEAASTAQDFSFHTRPLPKNLSNETKDEESDVEELNLAWNADGLDITGGCGEMNEEPLSGDKRTCFVSASSVLSKYEKIESKAAGFVHFKEKTGERRRANERVSMEDKTDIRVRIPKHLIPLRRAYPATAGKAAKRPETKSSTDYSAEAKRLRSELEAATTASQTLQQQSSSTRDRRMRSPPPPPPAIYFTNKKQRR